MRKIYLYAQNTRAKAIIGRRYAAGIAGLSD
jgi:hypothetical protein